MSFFQSASYITPNSSKVLKYQSVSITCAQVFTVIFTKPRASLAYTRNQDDARRVSREHRDVVTSSGHVTSARLNGKKGFISRSG